jgi:ABC-2 type transport system permease protein
MFREIFRFEIQNKLRRPAVYLYFAALLIFTCFSFANGALPLGEKQHVNSPAIIAFWSAGMSMLMMLVGSSVMGMALYRDIEFGTKDYYLTYPISRGGYFWGRFFGSFLFILFIASAIPLGVFLGTQIGPLLHLQDRLQYGPNLPRYYFQPFFTIVLPNVLFTSALFYGLVAVTRSVKVVYIGGLLLFLAYFVSVFFLDHSNNLRMMILSDPFALTGARIHMSNSNALQQNTELLPIEGDLLTNRIIWTSLGLVILLGTYLRFGFARFFSGRRDRSRIDEAEARIKAGYTRATAVSFEKGYSSSVFAALTRLELLNIVRDAYFWIIFGLGAFFLGFAFWMGDRDWGVPYLPQTSQFMAVFWDVFVFFIFFILLFYTGETLHRDRITRYAFINDSLPPPNWVANGSKLVALLVLALWLALMPLLVGVIVQLSKGFHDFNWPLYFAAIGETILPKLIEMVLFCYAVHVVINNKFAAHGVAAVLWLAAFFLVDTHTFDYYLLVYASFPMQGFGDMDGLGFMAQNARWFHAYWLLFGGLLIIVAALFFHRGVVTSWKERMQLVPERFDPVTRVFTAVLLLGFLTVGGWLYYNVSYLNDYTTHGEQIDRGIEYERALKHYDSLPIPVMTRAKLAVDIYPDEKKEETRGTVTIANLTDRPISEMLLDGDNLSDYSLMMDGRPVSFTYPLTYDRGVLDVFRPRRDTAPYRLYHLPRVLAPGDSAVVTVWSVMAYSGIPNGMYSNRALRNGWISTGGLPELGYDDDDEITSPYERRKHHMPPRPDDDDAIPQNDPVGIRTLKAGKTAHLYSLDLTVSTAEGQTPVGPGDLVQDWKANGRHFCRYTLSPGGSYPPLLIFSSRYACATDSVQLDHKVYIRIFYHPGHGANVGRFIAGYKDALTYYSQAYGPYPYHSISLAEGSLYAPRMGSSPALDEVNERYGWTAQFTDPWQFDYCYYTAAGLAAQQWWRFQVAPNETIGSLDIPEGLAWYDALVIAEHKIGKENMRGTLQNQLWPYLWRRTRMDAPDEPLIRANFPFVWGQKAAVELYALCDLIGEEHMNAALRAFKDSFAYRTAGPYAGAPDLYAVLKAHTPDSLQYFLEDSWMKRTFYDNKLDSVTVRATGRPDEYTVKLYVTAAKTWIEPDGRDSVVTGFQDYIDIGITGDAPKDSTAGGNRLPFLQKFKLSAGPHVITEVVHGKPHQAGIDPLGMLIDRREGDNNRSF